MILNEKDFLRLEKSMKEIKIVSDTELATILKDYNIIKNIGERKT